MHLKLVIQVVSLTVRTAPPSLPLAPPAPSGLQLVGAARRAFGLGSRPFNLPVTLPRQSPPAHHKLSSSIKAGTSIFLTAMLSMTFSSCSANQPLSTTFFLLPDV